ncbi:hypothetical protein [Streptomyces sp. ISL-11]|uniref:LppU/SCO3897 family protein n=1 Tax=Streptomyces sp. ISL-11 TaxID=2819174 RepID=UPI001BE933C4|nr:hypothetical protein [Streptomyces sp. ISL-11]MBT2383322.1 hypothetical protein [Streptomyces sp. ISL-11]
MSAPPPYYQNQQPNGYPQQQQQQHGYPQPPAPQRPQRPSALQRLLPIVVILAVFGGGAWYVWDYNTDPNGGKAKENAAQAAQAEENKKHDPNIGDCVKIRDPQGKPVPDIVGCDSGEAEYKMGQKLYGPDKKCGPEFAYGIQYSITRGTDYTLCFTKV